MGLEELKLAASGVEAISVHDVGNILGELGSELTLSPGLKPLRRAVDVPAVSVIREVEEMGDGDLEGLEIADVYDPDAVGAAGLG